MKKIISLALALVMVLSLTIVMFADDKPTTTLTTTVPAATYTLNIPEDQTITYSSTSTDIGSISISNPKGFTTGKNLEVSISCEDFKSENVKTTIPYILCARAAYQSGSTGSTPATLSSVNKVTFMGGTYMEQPHMLYQSTDYSIISFFITMKSEDWGKALAGTYTATITFTAEVVVDETT